MKHIKYLEIIEGLNTNPKLMRKVKIFAIVGVAGFLITGALMIWTGVSAINYVAASANQVIQSNVTQGHVENLKTELKGLPKLQAANCWSKAQSLLAVQPWLERRALDNLANLKVACFEQKSRLCQGIECEQMKDLINTAERSLYDSY